MPKIEDLSCSSKTLSFKTIISALIAKASLVAKARNLTLIPTFSRASLFSGKLLLLLPYSLVSVWERKEGGREGPQVKISKYNPTMPRSSHFAVP